ncbi:unnamed protein product [Rotaria sordida]|uniref:Uncharacterized protein n=1 Tax=Rotaria sordida TaxID=392033 RepID=A0A813X2K5_9BILA|nr:unnamed protein product [Rotaria sordida]
MCEARLDHAAGTEDNTTIQTVLSNFSLLDRIDGEKICNDSLPYEKCSLNTGCGCFPLSYNNKSSICAYLYVTCSELLSYAQDNKTCYQPGYTCVKHSRCQNSPLCYPMKMATRLMCPLILSTSISPIPDDGICENAKWNTTGIAVAGGNNPGWVWGVDVDDCDWSHSGVNHVLIFEFDSWNHLTYEKLLEIGTCLIS